MYQHVIDLICFCMKYKLSRYRYINVYIYIHVNCAFKKLIRFALLNSSKTKTMYCKTQEIWSCTPKDTRELLPARRVLKTSRNIGTLARMLTRGNCTQTCWNSERATLLSEHFWPSCCSIFAGDIASVHPASCPVFASVAAADPSNQRILVLTFRGPAPPATTFARDLPIEEEQIHTRRLQVFVESTVNMNMLDSMSGAFLSVAWNCFPQRHCEVVLARASWFEAQSFEQIGWLGEVEGAMSIQALPNESVKGTFPEKALLCGVRAQRIAIAKVSAIQGWLRISIMPVHLSASAFCRHCGTWMNYFRLDVTLCARVTKNFALCWTTKCLNDLECIATEVSSCECAFICIGSIRFLPSTYSRLPLSLCSSKPVNTRAKSMMASLPAHMVQVSGARASTKKLPLHFYNNHVLMKMGSYILLYSHTFEVCVYIYIHIGVLLVVSPATAASNCLVSLISTSSFLYLFMLGYRWQ